MGSLGIYRPALIRSTRKRKQSHPSRSRAARSARLAHNQEVAGLNPASAITATTYPKFKSHPKYSINDEPVLRQLMAQRLLNVNLYNYCNVRPPLKGWVSFWLPLPSILTTPLSK